MVVYILNTDPSTRRWVEEVVTSAGFHASSFSSRVELLPHVTPGAIACAILDVSLADGSAFELQAELAGAGISTVFLTRQRCFSSCVRAVKAGAVDYLLMPCKPSSLIHVVHIALNQAQTAQTQRLRANQCRSRYEQLTARERQVFALVSNGLRNKQIAHQLNISQVTVQIHRGHVMRKMAAGSIASLVRMADALPIVGCV